jgi:hypothetical protein
MRRRLRPSTLVRAGGLTWVLAASIVAPCRSQAAVDTVMQLNRLGQWASAAAVAHERLADNLLGPSERCATAVGLAHAETLLGHRDAAEAALESARRLCSSPTAPPWAEREIVRIERMVAPSQVGSAHCASDTPTAPPDDGFWHLSPVASTSLPPAFLSGHVGLCRRTAADACLVVYHDSIVQEWYSPRYAYPMFAMSSTKSVTGLLTAMLVADGRLHLEDRVCRYVPTWCDGLRASVTVRHLLSMTSGLPRFGRDSSVGYVRDKDAFVEQLTPTAEPGTVWAYSNEGAQLLSPILDAAAGEPIQRYARRRLFDPMGMRSTSFQVDAAGHAWTYADICTTARDLARIGVLMAHRGSWRGSPILASAWTDSLVQPGRLNPEYGLLWWVFPEAHAYAALGHLDTDVIVAPGRDLVLVRMQSKPDSAVAEGTYLRAVLRMLSSLRLGDD